MMILAVLEVKNLKTYYFTDEGVARSVDDISFTLDKGEVLGLAGESGCGKSTAVRSLIRLVPTPGKIVGGSILFKGEDLLKKSEEEMRKVNWKGISMVFQAAMNAFDPLYSIVYQITEAIVCHESKSKKDAVKKAEELLEMVGINQKRGKSYPHEFSGGMLQRALIAMALSCNPEILIMDEPTTALDVITQAKLFVDMERLHERTDVAMILVTHDLALIASLCNKVAIMYAGQIVEYAGGDQFFRKPIHPYSQLLLRAFPSLHDKKTELGFIPGTPPNLLTPPSGCRFRERCPLATELCTREMPRLTKICGGHEVACHFSEKILHNEILV